MEDLQEIHDKMKEWFPHLRVRMRGESAKIVFNELAKRDITLAKEIIESVKKNIKWNDMDKLQLSTNKIDLKKSKSSAHYGDNFIFMRRESTTKRLLGSTWKKCYVDSGSFAHLVLWLHLHFLHVAQLHLPGCPRRVVQLVCRWPFVFHLGTRLICTLSCTFCWKIDVLPLNPLLCGLDEFAVCPWTQTIFLRWARNCVLDRSLAHLSWRALSLPPLQLASDLLDQTFFAESCKATVSRSVFWRLVVYVPRPQNLGYVSRCQLLIFT